MSELSASGGRGRDRAAAVGLCATGLVYSYGRRRVVDGVALSVGPGEVVGLLGPNGAGKTTCFRMIAGMLRPEAGRISLAGTPLEGLPLWKRVRAGLAYLPQNPVGFRRLSVADNLRIPLRARRAPPDALPELLTLVGLTHLAASRAGSLSGGERRRLEIARCLATAPSVMLLDEPFAGVDPVAVGDLQRRIRHLSTQGIGVLITDHAAAETLGICDRAIILDGGGVIARGTPAEVAADPHVRSRYLGAEFRLPAPPVGPLPS